jgi:WD40 repeat protein
MLARVTPLEPRVSVNAGKGCRVVSFSPDGNIIATVEDLGFSARGGPIRLWDIKTGAAQGAFESSWRNINAIAFSPDSKKLVATDQEGGLKLWDWTTGEELGHRTLITKFGNYLDARFIADGKIVAFNDYERGLDTDYIKFWDPISNKDLGTINGWRGSFVVSPDGDWAAIWDRDNSANTATVMLWNLRDGSDFATLVAKHTLPIHSIVFSRDLWTFAASVRRDEEGLGCDINLYDLKTGEILATTSFHDEKTSVQELHFSPAETMLIATAGGGHQLDWHWRLTLWDIGSGLTEVASFTETPTFTRDEKWLVVPKRDGAELFDARTMSKIADLMVASDKGPSRFFSYNNTIDYPLLLCSPDSKIVVISHLHTDEKCDPVAQWIADHLLKSSGHSSGCGTRIWSTESGRQVATLPWLFRADFSPDGTALVALRSDDGIISIWDMPPRPPVLLVLLLAIPAWLGIVVPLLGCRLWLRRRKAHS